MLDFFAGNLGSTSHRDNITILAQAWAQGEQAALEQLVPRVYAELHRLAHRYMKGERPGHDLQTTALINEAYVRLASTKLQDCPDRAYFFGVCARIMRQVLVDWARAQSSSKRRGDRDALELNESLAADAHAGPDLVAIDDALHALAGVDARKAQIVELRFFGGFSLEETSQALGVSPGTVARDWTIAKMFLRRELGGYGRSAGKSTTIRGRHG